MITLSKEKKLNIIGLFLVALSLFPILRPAVQSILIISFCLTSIILYWENFLVRRKSKKVIVIFLFFTGYYIWYLFTALWSQEKGEALIESQSNILLLLFPIIFLFFLPQISQIIFQRVLLTFVFAMSFYLILWYQSYITGVSHYQVLKLDELPIKDYAPINQLSYFLTKGYYWVSGTSIRGYRLANEELRLFVHHNYIASYLVIGFFAALKSILLVKKLFWKILISPIAILFLLFVFYLPSVVNQLVLIVTIPAFVYYFLSKKIALSIALIGLLGIGFLFFQNYEKVQSIKLVENDSLTSKELSIIDFYRYHVYTCISRKIPENFFFGMGKGNVQPYLNSCLPDDEWPGLNTKKMEYNTHSQPLNFLISGGIIGLFLFVGFWVKLYFLVFKKGSILLLIILTVIFANLLFENYLTRIWGAFIFMFFSFVCLQTNLSPSTKRLKTTK